MATALDSVQQLIKAMEAGSYDAAPSSLVQGGALQIEDLSPVMNNVTYEDKHLKLQKIVSSTSCKSITAQFDRQLGYGNGFGFGAQLEGNVGQEETSDYVRVTVPMAFYSQVRRVNIASTMVATVDGKKNDERAAADAATHLAGQIELDLFRGLDDFSNAGVFDGNPLVIPTLPPIHGLALQIRQSDFQSNAKDKMFAEFGSSESVVVSAGGLPITQDKVEDVALRSALNFGKSERLVIDPVALSAYNKIVLGKERIILAGSPQDATGGDLRKQWVSGGTVSLEATMFLRGKSQPAPARSNGPSAPTTSSAATSGGSLAAGDYYYYVTSGNETGESPPSTPEAVTGVTLNQKVTITITGVGSNHKYYNVYRSAPGGTAASAKFIGRVMASAVNGTGTTTFIDLGNKVPGFVTGFLIDGDVMEIRELSPYSRLKLAVTDLSTPEAHFRFLTLAVTQPRKMVLLDNIKGTL